MSNKTEAPTHTETKYVETQVVPIAHALLQLEKLTLVNLELISFYARQVDTSVNLMNKPHGEEKADNE